MIRFEEILEKVEAYNPQTDQDLLRRAYVFSAARAPGTGAPLGRGLPDPSR